MISKGEKSRPTPQNLVGPVHYSCSSSSDFAFCWLLERSNSSSTVIKPNLPPEGRRRQCLSLSSSASRNSRLQMSCPCLCCPHPTQNCSLRLKEDYLPIPLPLFSSLLVVPVYCPPYGAHGLFETSPSPARGQCLSSIMRDAMYLPLI